VGMWERRAELEGFAAVMEGVRNALPGQGQRPVRENRRYRLTNPD